MKVEVVKTTMQYLDVDKVVPVFDSLSATFESGTSTAIIGASGVGKTTLLYLLGGLEHPTSGDIILGGTSLQKLDDSKGELARFRGEHIGFVFQFHHLLPEFDAVENVMMPLLISGADPAVARKRAVDLLERTGLGHRLDHRPGQLSGGEQQRVAVARAFATKPGVVLADEPTGNLDAKTGQAIIDLLKTLQRDEKITLIVVTHSQTMSAALDRVIEMTPDGIVQH